MKPGADRIKSYCRWCDGETNHDVLFSQKVNTGCEDYWEETTYSVIRCRGCETISFHQEILNETFFEANGYGEGEYVPEVVTFPFHKGWISPIDSWSVPHEISSIYEETVNALNNDLLRLAGAGLRAVVESVCKFLAVDGKTLESKINKLKAKGIITQKDRDRLHAIRFIGNDSVHVLKDYSREELMVGINIVNGILSNLFVIEESFKRLSERPISTVEEFEEVLREEVSKRNPGEVDTLRNLLKNSRKIIKEDISNYETTLKQRITEGKFAELSLCPSPVGGRPQQYKIPNSRQNL